jgi:hypothetical protein
MNNINDVVQVDIIVNNPTVSEESFGTMLIVGPAPAVTPPESPAQVGVYKNLKEVTDAGWVAVGAGSDPIGVAARVAFSQSVPPAELYIAVQQIVSETLEAITATLDRANTTPGWYAIAPAGVSTSDYVSIAQWTEVSDKLAAFVTGDLTNPLGKLFQRSFVLYGKETPATAISGENAYGNVAWLARCLSSYEPGEETWALKDLALIKPSGVNGTTKNALADQNINYYLEVAGRGATMGGMVTNGEWIDIVRFIDWLRTDMQTRVYNALRINGKLPFTDGGIGVIQGQMIASLQAGQAIGGIAPESFDADGAVIPGFTVKVPKAASVDASDKVARILRGCKFTARLAGAVHSVHIAGSLIY